MRIVSGNWRGRRLRTPRGQAVRPTADRVREAIFDILGGRTEGARVLDLFAGTGALGLEALSRGASSAVLVESDPRAFAVLRRNVLDLGAAAAETFPMDCRAALRLLRGRGSRFDLVFLDPPYGKGIAAGTAEDLAGAGLLEPGGTVVVEEAARTPDSDFPAAWERTGDRRYGDTRVMIFTVGKEQG
ncbi:MAG: 16S rRNA (guanine(966)-N(2))-methyltransferase RsmD [Deltaproteobacteria bacterium]|nr:16S rRNA (guanine(966)-N(2))-methyltransferase RsmD [Deltaproteobacteria bacterium]